MKEWIKLLTYKEALENINKRQSEHFTPESSSHLYMISRSSKSLAYEMAYLVSKINFGIFLQILQIFTGIQIKCMNGHLFV